MPRQFHGMVFIPAGIVEENVLVWVLNALENY